MLDLVVRGFKILVRNRRIRVHSTVLGPNVRLAVCIKLLALVKVEVDGITPRDEEEDEWNAHSLAGTDPIRNVAKDDWNNGTATDGGDEEGSAALGMATETSHYSRISSAQYDSGLNLRVRAKIIGKMH